MKNIIKIKILFLVIFGLSLLSCTDDKDILTEDAQTGGYFDLETKYQSISYVVGNGQSLDYPVKISVVQKPSAIKTINVYKQFFRKTIQNGKVVYIESNKMLHTTLTPSISVYQTYVNIESTFNNLREGLNIAGVVLPTSDTEYNIGDYFLLTYETILDSDGSKRVSTFSTKINVATRFSGIYKCVEGLYYRIGVLTYTTEFWPTQTVIESVDATTYRVKKYFGPFTNTSTATGGDYYFSIDSSDNISYPAQTPDGINQQGNGQPFMTCVTNPSEFQVLSCSNTNYVVRDNVNGKDRLYMTFGYLNGTGLGREFYQVMEKIVE